MGKTDLRTTLLITVNINSDFKILPYDNFFSGKEQCLVISDKVIKFFLCNVVNKELILGVREVSSWPFLIVYIINIFFYLCIKTLKAI